MRQVTTIALASAALFFVAAVVFLLRGQELVALVLLAVAIGDAAVAWFLRRRSST